MRDVPDQLREWSQSLAESVDPVDIDRVTSPSTAEARAFGRWLAVAASVIIVGGGVFAVTTLRNDSPDRIGPATNPPPSPTVDTTATSEPGDSPTSSPAATTVAAGSEATGRLKVTSRYPFDNRELPVFPSPDGRLYLDGDGCVVAIGDDGPPACPEGEHWVASANWAPDGSIVVHDRNAFAGGGDSDIRAVFIDDPSGDTTGIALRATFANLTAEPTEEEPNLDVMPLVVGDQIRFLRLPFAAGPREFEIVTIDVDGGVIGSAPTSLSSADLISDKSAVLVAGRHVLIGTPGADVEGQLITVDADGTTLAHPIASESVVRFYRTTASDAVVMAFDAGPEWTTGRIRTFDGADYGSTGFEITERGFDVRDTTGFDPTAIAFAPDRGELVAAYSNADATSTTLRVWNAADTSITDIGTVPVRAVHEMRWMSSDELVVFGDDEILTLQLTG